MLHTFLRSLYHQNGKADQWEVKILWISMIVRMPGINRMLVRMVWMPGILGMPPGVCHGYYVWYGWVWISLIVMMPWDAYHAR